MAPRFGGYCERSLTFAFYSPGKILLLPGEIVKIRMKM